MEVSLNWKDSVEGNRVFSSSSLVSSAYHKTSGYIIVKATTMTNNSAQVINKSKLLQDLEKIFFLHLCFIIHLHYNDMRHTNRGIAILQFLVRDVDFNP